MKRGELQSRLSSPCPIPSDQPHVVSHGNRQATAKLGQRSFFQQHVNFPSKQLIQVPTMPMLSLPQVPFRATTVSCRQSVKHHQFYCKEYRRSGRISFILAKFVALTSKWMGPGPRAGRPPEHQVLIHSSFDCSTHFSQHPVIFQICLFLCTTPDLNFSSHHILLLGFRLRSRCCQVPSSCCS